MAQGFRKIHFLPNICEFLQNKRCAIFQINTDPVIQQNTNIFTQDTLYSSFIWKKIGSFHRKHFSKRPFFTTFFLFLIISDILNKYRLSNRPAKKLFLQKTPYTPPSFRKRSGALHYRRFSKHPPIYHFFNQFSRWMKFAIFQINTNLVVIQQNTNFYTRDFMSLVYFEKKFVLSAVNVCQNILFLPHFHYFNSKLYVIYFK